MSRALSFLKWAGSKRGVMGDLLRILPADPRGTFYEPMVGSGTVFFSLGPARAVLSDVNAELMSCYGVVRDRLPALLRELEGMPNTEEHFLRVRAMDPASLPPVERAARTIYLNKTCYNGLYRVNSRGVFNVPYGRITWANIKDEEALTRASGLLRRAELRLGDYASCLADAREGDLVYLDPPYLGTGATVFYSYQPERFGEPEHRRLARTVRDLHGRGCHFVLSNSDAPLVRELYRGFHIAILRTRRPLNCKTDRRRGWEELAIHNLDWTRS